MATDGADPVVRTLAIAGFAVVVALAVTYMVSQVLLGPRLGNAPRLAFLLNVKLFVSTFNVVVLVALVATYAAVYRSMPNQFTLSLILFSLALLLYALTSNPIVHVLLGFRGSPLLGPFTFIPDVFASVAIVVLLYQSYK